MSHAEKVISMALPFVWLGLVIGISAIETPRKFIALLLVQVLYRRRLDALGAGLAWRRPA